MQHLPQDPFALPGTNLHVKRKPPGELDHAMVIQKRDSALQAGRHAGSIQFDQNIIGQVGIEIQVHHPLGKLGQ